MTFLVDVSYDNNLAAYFLIRGVCSYFDVFCNLEMEVVRMALKGHYAH